MILTPYNKMYALARLFYRGKLHSQCIWARNFLHCAEVGKVPQTKLFRR